jgi:hypothetical protein
VVGDASSCHHRRLVRLGAVESPGAIHWDFRLIAAYAVFFSGLASLPWEVPPLLARVLTVAMFAPLTAGVFDAIENAGMLRIIEEEARAGMLPSIVTFCSIAKLTLLIATSVVLTLALTMSVIANI